MAARGQPLQRWVLHVFSNLPRLSQPWEGRSDASLRSCSGYLPRVQDCHTCCILLSPGPGVLPRSHSHAPCSPCLLSLVLLLTLEVLKSSIATARNSSPHRPPSIMLRPQLMPLCPRTLPCGRLCPSLHSCARCLCSCPQSERLADTVLGLPITRNASSTSIPRSCASHLASQVGGRTRKRGKIGSS